MLSIPLLIFSIRIYNINFENINICMLLIMKENHINLLKNFIVKIQQQFINKRKYKKLEIIMQENRQQNEKDINSGQQKQIKQEQQIPLSNTCKFFIPRKRRFCKFQAVKESQFCPAHCSDQDKIECPYEKGMFIDANKFQRHLQICPKIKNKKQSQKSQWFSKGVNLNQQQLPGQVSIINAVIDIQQQKLISVIRKVVNLYCKTFEDRSTQYLYSTGQQKIENLTNDHIQGYLIAQAAFKAGLIRDDIIYLQFGAGKGILSYHIAQRVKKQCNKMSKNVLLQRQTRRNKFDRFMKSNPYFQRYKSDVSDFDVKKLPQIMADTAASKNPTLDPVKQAAQINQLQIVGICKHMCGGALDISLRALMKTKMSGCILASCCHHLCTYDNYLNNPYFQQNNFTPDDILIMFRISAWGTKLYTIKQQQINFKQLENLQKSQLNLSNKVVIGRICKRLIDFGRAQILNGKILRYCSDQITPENFVILTG